PLPPPPPTPPPVPYRTLFRYPTTRTTPRLPASGRPQPPKGSDDRQLGPVADRRRRARRRPERRRVPGLLDGRHARPAQATAGTRSEEHTSELQSRVDLVCRLL